jgi:hypothetical protein
VGNNAATAGPIPGPTLRPVQAPQPPEPRRGLVGDLDRLFVVALVSGTLLRIGVALDPVLGRLNSDQAVDLLQAQHVAEGEYQAYYWGQQYAGTLLPTVMGWLFAVLGTRLWLLPLLLGLASTAVAVLTRQIGIALGRRRAGNVAGALLSVGPATWVFVGTVSSSFYAIGMALSLGGLLLVVRARDGLDARSGAAAGLLTGLALWVSPMSPLTVLPTVALAAGPLLRRPRALLATVAGGLLGLLPVILAAIARGQLSQPRFPSATPAEVRLEQAVTGIWVSVFTRFAPEQVPRWLLDRLASAALLVAIAAAVVLALRLRRDRSVWPDVALLLPVLLWLPLVVHLRLPSDAPASRYALALLPYLALALAVLLRTAARQVVAVVLLGAFALTGLWQAGPGPRPGTDPLHSPSYEALSAELLSRGRTAVRADYWVAYRLAVESGERVVADPPTMSRYPPYARAAADAPQSTFVVFAGLGSDLAMQQFFAGVPGVERVQLAQFAVYYADRRLTGAELPPFRPTPDVPDP